MGCISSKSVGEKGKTTGNQIGNHITSGRTSKARSVDSGIGLSGEEKKRGGSVKSKVINNHVDGSRPPTRQKKGVAFDIPAKSDSIVKSHPPKRFKSRLEISRNGSSLDPVKTSSDEKEKLRQIVQKQVHAERLREQERHSVIARQKRREARARKVQERRRKLLEEAENWGDDELSDIENDQNFNTAEEYDLLSDDDDFGFDNKRRDDDVSDHEAINTDATLEDPHEPTSRESSDRNSSDYEF